MISSIKRIKRKLEKCTNPNEAYIYKAVLDSYEQRVREFLSSDLSSEDKKQLLDSIQTKQEEIQTKCDLLSKSDYNAEELARLRSFSSTLDDYRRIINNSPRMPQKGQKSEAKENFSIDLAVALSEVRNVVYKKSNFSSNVDYSYEPDYETISELINIDSDEEVLNELTAYLEEENELKDLKAYTARRVHVREELDRLLPNTSLLEIYDLLIKQYFKDKNAYDPLVVDRKEKLMKLDAYSKEFRFFKKRITDNLSKDIEESNKRIKHLQEEISHDVRQLNIFVQGIDDTRIKSLFDYNCEILLTLGYIPTTGNPFEDKSLDVTFEDTLDSTITSDIKYFIGSNIHNINATNLAEAISFLDEILSRLETRIKSSTDNHQEFYNLLSDKGKRYLEEEPDLVKTVITLNSTTNKYGIKSMSYIYALDGLRSNDEATTRDVVELISNEDESLTWSRNPLIKDAKVLKKKQN